jgi:hypothetical protein
LGKIDTGSSDLVVETPSSAFCQSSSTACIFGTCEPLLHVLLRNIINVEEDTANSSSTYAYLNSDFIATYGVGSASGDYALDLLQLGGTNIPGLQFGIMYTANQLSIGVFGIGFTNANAQVERGAPAYNNFPALLV